MNVIPISTIQQLVRGDTLTARRRAARPDHSAWVAVLPKRLNAGVYLNAVDENTPCDLVVRSFELPDASLVDDVYEGDVVDLREFNVSSFYGLAQVLRELDVDWSQLQYSNETGYPL